MNKKFYKKSIVTVVISAMVLSILGWSAPTPALAATAVALGNASGFAILAGSAITETGTGFGDFAVIGGNVGLSPSAGSNYTGLTAAEVDGTIYAVDAAGPSGSVNNPALLTLAKNDLVTAYNDAAGQTPVSTVPTELGGTTKNAGVYDSAAGTFGITGTLTLDAQGDANAVFIFKTASTLITAGASNVVLANGAQACNVFWQVGSSATLGTTSVFKGNILALTTATLTTGATVEGRVLARNGAVTLDTNVVTLATCAAPPPPPAPPSPSPSPTPPASSLSVDNTITIVKQVINDNGGTAIFSDFHLFVNGNPVQSGESVRMSAGTYTITETGVPGYTGTFTGNCDVNGRIIHGGLNTHDDICTVINNDNGAPAVAPIPPLIDVVKVPNPLALPGGPGPVTYTYTATNIGTVPMTDVTLVGDTCSPLILISGDTNGDSKLDVNEAWVYTCTKTLTETTKNTVTATGHANGLIAVDVASAIVVVGAPVVPPLIHVIKIPSPLALPAGAGAVTYNYTVTNPGTEPLSNVFITDDKCTGLPGRVVGHPGDLNNNDLLESNESWSFDCQTNLTQTTVNTVIATGSANGLTVTDFALATVVVAVPKLPNTGSGPEERTTMWGIIVLAGALLVVSTSLVVLMKKRTM